MREMQRYEPPERHYHEPVMPHTGFNPLSLILGVLCLFVFGLIITGIIEDREQVAIVSVIMLQVALVLAFVLFVAGTPLAIFLYVQHKRKMASIREKHAEADLKAKEEQVQREKEEHEIKMYLAQTRLYADPNGNRPHIFNPRTYEITEVSSGNFSQPVPGHFHYEINDTSTRQGQEAQQNLLAAGAMHIPTFAESLKSGDIGPGQRELLFCHEIVRDEATRQPTGIDARFCQLTEASTLLLSGASKSGKTTYMSNIALQQAFMYTLFFAIDPHRNHPEKSLTAKLGAIIDAGYFVMPPAMEDAEVYRVYKALQTECQARVDGKETRLSGYNIVLLVDEIVALMARAQRSHNKEIQQMYEEFGVFLRDLGVQYNKFGVNGVFGTQYVTKEVLGKAEWRDACTGQGVMRLPANQAQALKLLTGDDLRSVPKLPTGHGYMVFGGEYEPIRMASGNTTVEDVEHVARVIPASPLSKKTYGGFTHSTIVDEVGNQSETTEKPQRNQSGNYDKSSLEADLEQKLQKVLAIEAEGGQKPEVMKTVWNVSPGGSEKYKQAEEEYKQIKRMIAERMKEQ